MQSNIFLNFNFVTVKQLKFLNLKTFMACRPPLKTTYVTWVPVKISPLLSNVVIFLARFFDLT